MLAVAGKENDELYFSQGKQLETIQVQRLKMPSFQPNKLALKTLWSHCDSFIIDIPVVQGYFCTWIDILT